MNVPFLNPGAQFQSLRTEILAAVEAVLERGPVSYTHLTLPTNREV